MLRKPGAGGLAGRPATDDLAGELVRTARLIASALECRGQINRFGDSARCRIGSARVLTELSVLVVEAVRNAIQHAHPAGALGSILLGCHRAATGEVVVEICDDGVGFSGGFDPVRDGGAGFCIMRSVAAKLGGALTFRSSSLGLRLRLRLPSSVASFADNNSPAPESLLAALPTGIYVTDAEGSITWFNRAATAIWGRRPVLGEKWSGAWKLRDPQGQPLAHQDAPMAVALREGREMHGAEAIVERPDGSSLPLMVFPTLLRDADGQVAGAVNVLVEIGERKRAEQRQELLAGEMQHRAKNLFALARAVVAQSLRGSPLQGPRDAVLGRLQALAGTYDKLNAAGWEGAELGEIVRGELSAFAGRVEIDGPEVTLSPRAAQNFALAVHELATNAAKHGALSVPSGRIAVTWRIAGVAAELHFRWVERGGPVVASPARKGFGSVMLEQVVARDFGRAPHIMFAPDGLTCEVTAALAIVAAESPVAAAAD